MQLTGARKWKGLSYFGAAPRPLNAEPWLLLSGSFVFKDTAREDDISAREQKWTSGSSVIRDQEDPGRTVKGRGEAVEEAKIRKTQDVP